METNPGPRRPVPAVCRILCSNVRGLAGNLSDLTVASSQYYILSRGDFGLRYASRVVPVIWLSFGLRTKMITCCPGHLVVIDRDNKIVVPVNFVIWSQLSRSLVYYSTFIYLSVLNIYLFICETSEIY